jgi:hypothetical protein
VNAKAEIITADTKEADQKVIADFYKRMPLMSRLDSVKSEWIRHFASKQESEPPERRLPGYCYNIFEKFGRTTLNGFPKLEETITGDIAGLASCKDVEQAKRLIKIDWVRFGRLFGILIRQERFVKTDWEGQVQREGLFSNEAPVGDLTWLVEGSKWPLNQDSSGVLNVGKFFAEGLKTETSPHFEGLFVRVEYYARLAYLWGCDALADMCRGMASGLTGFLDETGQFVGVNNRENLYWFLLIAWPEIKEMLESKPRKTVPDLYEWMLPFIRERLPGDVSLEILRGACAPPPSGIGLSLRPLKSRRSKSSA